MNYTVRDYQIRVNSLMVLPKPIKVDGMSGPATRAAINFALEHEGLNHKEELMDPSGITRVHWHWTASGYNVNSNITSHYNDVFDNVGNHYDGGATALQQAAYVPGRTGVSHTYRANTGAVGLSVACMRGASTSGNKVNPGDSPITWEGIDAMLDRTNEYCKLFDIRPSPWTTLTHAEVSVNIRIKQRGKWDIRVLPDNPTLLLNSVEAGDILRKRMMERR